MDDLGVPLFLETSIYSVGSERPCLEIQIFCSLDVPLEAARLFNQICDAVRYLHTEKQLVWSSVEKLPLSESRISKCHKGIASVFVNVMEVYRCIET